MVHWEPGTQYNHGDVVTYEGADYKIIQPHRSQGDWAPPVTPALWACLQGGGGRQADTKPQQPFQEQKWHQLPPLSGGIEADAGLLGSGLAAHKHHEEVDAEEWSRNNWITEAKLRTQDFYSQGSRGPCTWVLNQGRNIPHDAIVAGNENTWTLYICRAFYQGSISPGKASDVFPKGAVIGYNHEEIHIENYEILVGDMNGLKWVPTSGRFNLYALDNHRPVEGGRESDGTPLYVVRAQHNGYLHPGKTSEKLKGAFIPYGGEEKQVNDYEVLCYL